MWHLPSINENTAGTGVVLVPRFEITFNVEERGVRGSTLVTRDVHLWCLVTATAAGAREGFCI